MTEQEKREKAMIEKLLSDEQIKIANTVDEFTKLQQVGISRCYADALYDAGYRKADEVRKETAKRFLKMLYDMGVDRQTIETCGIYDVNGSELARFVSQEFGVEVEE